jgi:CheY-like chemotaxis protein
MPVRVLVLTNQRHTRRQVSRALVAGGLEAQFAAGNAEARELAASAPPSLLILDADALEAPAIAEALKDLCGNEERRLPVVLLSLADDKRPLLDLIQSYEIGNLVAKHGAIRAVYPALDERELLVTCRKVLERDIFGIEKYVGGWGVLVHRHVVRAAQEKGPVLEALDAFLHRLDCPQVVIPEIVTVAEELILNAVVHAPRVHGKPKYEHLEPSELPPLEPTEYVHVAYACDGARLMLSVQDQFGALDKRTVLSYVGKALSRTRLSVEEKQSGAGLGLSMAFLGIHQLIFNVQEGVRTEALAGWYLRVNSASEFRQVSKSLNLFWLSGSEGVRRLAEAAAPTPVTAAPKPSGPTSRLAGRIDEDTNFSQVLRSSRLDLRQVTGFTSRGVVNWLRFVNSLVGKRIEVTGCPDPLVRLASEVKGVLRGLNVATVMAPYECSSCGLEAPIELTVSEVLADAPQPCGDCGAVLTFAGMREDYEALASAAR